MERELILRQLRDNRDEVLAHCDAEAAEHDKNYGAGKWTVREVLAHLADTEMINLWRFGRAAAEPGSTVEPFDQTLWAAGLDYAGRPVEISRGLFLAARNSLIQCVQDLPDATLENGYALHHEKGKLSPVQWADLTIGHTEHHVSQIVAARTGQPWTPPQRDDAWMYTQPGGR